MKTTRKSQYGVGGGGWRTESGGYNRPGTVMEEVMYLQNNRYGPRNIRLMAKSEVAQTIKDHKPMYTLKHRRSSLLSTSAAANRPGLPSLEKVMDGREVLRAESCTPELLASMAVLPKNFSQTLDEILGISSPKPKSSHRSPSRRQDSGVQYSYSDEEDNGPPSEVNHMAWPRSSVAENEWMRLINKFKVVSKKRHKQAALAAAAESAFSAETSGMQRATDIEHSGLDLAVLPRQWMNSQMTKICLMACNLPKLPTQFGLLVPNLEKLLLAHNKLEDLPPTFNKLEKLQDLGLTANRFKIFPDIICDLHGLESLTLTNNQISAIPAAIASCTALSALHLARNPIKRMPLTVGLLSRLAMLDFDKTPNPGIPGAPQIEHHLPEWGVDASVYVIRDLYLNLLKNRIIRIKQALQSNFLRSQAAFKNIDADGSGDLDRDEMFAALKMLKCDTSNFDELWAWLDIGHVGTLNHQEFMRSAMSNMFDKPVDALDIFKKDMVRDIELRAEEKRKRDEADALLEAKTQATIASHFGNAVQKGVARLRRNSLMKRQ